MKKQIWKSVLSVMVLVFAVSGSVQAERTDTSPSAVEMISDFVVLRPLLMGATAGGTALYLVSSPFSYVGGNSDEAAEVLVGRPFRATFTRCLGCSLTESDVLSKSNQNDDND